MTWAQSTLNHFHIPAQLSQEDREILQLAPENSVYVSSYFNKQALRHMAVSATKLEKKTRYGTQQIQSFPRGSLAVKAVWRVVPSKGIPLGLWKQEVADELLSHGTFRLLESCWRKIHVIQKLSHPISVFNKPIKPEDIIGLGYFYYVRITPEILKQLTPINTAQQPVLNDYLILVGLHIASKEIPDWVWATFWFSEAPYVDLKNSPAPWSNFQLNATLSMRSPKPPKPPQEDQVEYYPFKKIYNPYLEAIQKNGLLSNCMTCHARAAYPLPEILTLQNGAGVEVHQLEGKVRTDYSFSTARARP